MTVSARASAIYKLIRPSGGTWQQAMKQAYEEIVKPEREREEREAKQKLSASVIRARNSIGGRGILWSNNNVIGDIIEAVENKYLDGGYPYPYTLALANIEGSDISAFIKSEEDIKSKGFTDDDMELIEDMSGRDNSGLSEIESLIYTYSNRDEWDSRWRIHGRVSNDLKISIDNIIDKLGINSSSLPTYSSYSAYFK